MHAPGAQPLTPQPTGYTMHSPLPKRQRGECTVCGEFASPRAVLCNECWVAQSERPALSAACTLCEGASPEVVLPRGWTCVPACACWDVQALRPALKACPWVQRLRPLVHDCAMMCSLEQRKEAWHKLYPEALAALREGMPMRLLSAVLSELHVWATLGTFAIDGSPPCTWMTCMGAAPRFWSGVETMVQELLDLGACPNLAWSHFFERRRRSWVNVTGPKPATVTLEEEKVIELAGGFPQWRQPPGTWLRYHGRPHKRAWLSNACRLQQQRRAHGRGCALHRAQSQPNPPPRKRGHASITGCVPAVQGMPLGGDGVAR